jgi:hypothetical protein
MRQFLARQASLYFGNTGITNQSSSQRPCPAGTSELTVGAGLALQITHGPEGNSVAFGVGAGASLGTVLGHHDSPGTYSRTILPWGNGVAPRGISVISNAEVGLILGYSYNATKSIANGGYSGSVDFTAPVVGASAFVGIGGITTQNCMDG